MHEAKMLFEKGGQSEMRIINRTGEKVTMFASHNFQGTIFEKYGGTGFGQIRMYQKVRQPDMY
jgi:hypothetical protein